VFSVDPTDTPIDWLDSDHVIRIYCRSMPVPGPYKSDIIRSAQLRVSRKLEESRRIFSSEVPE
jgi:hypothetical protein